MSSQSEAPTHAYVDSSDCGCIMGLCVDNPDHGAETRKFVSQAMRAGGHVTRVTIEEARALPWKCGEHSETAEVSA